MDYDDQDWWYDLGKMDGCKGRESAEILILTFDGVEAAEAYGEGYADGRACIMDEAFKAWEE